MADWRARREAFKSLREQERALWNVGKSDEALDVREKADCLYPNFAAAENDMQKEMDALLRGAPLPVSPPSMSLIK
ncbi:hypothetical protein CDO24_04305 [Sinorhizobium meliloti]|nr:hypothetical protein CDO24_04305 [Sinorhizobium meliloti]